MTMTLSTARYVIRREHAKKLEKAQRTSENICDALDRTDFIAVHGIDRAQHVMLANVRDSTRVVREWKNHGSLRDAKQNGRAKARRFAASHCSVQSKAEHFRRLVAEYSTATGKRRKDIRRSIRTEMRNQGYKNFSSFVAANK